LNFQYARDVKMSEIRRMLVSWLIVTVNGICALPPFQAVVG
jgi:hypothetical protein